MPHAREGAATTGETGIQQFVKGFHGVRYQVKDVTRAVTFYTGQLGFNLEHQ